jgi:ribosomal protein S18 acetylase RimI-like enzyme
MDNGTFTIRAGTSNDAERVMEAFSLFLQRIGNPAYIHNSLSDYPSALAFAGEDLVGFAYCGFMAPDLIEIANIALHPDYRSSGLGSRLLDFLEKEASKTYSAIMLTNSDLYSGKRNASNFYLRNGYRLLAGTGETNLFWKDLIRKP